MTWGADLMNKALDMTNFWDPNDSILGPLGYSLVKMMPTLVEVADSSTLHTHHLAASILKGRHEVSPSSLHSTTPFV